MRRPGGTRGAAPGPELEGPLRLHGRGRRGGRTARRLRPRVPPRGRRRHRGEARPLPEPGRDPGVHQAGGRHRPGRRPHHRRGDCRRHHLRGLREGDHPLRAGRRRPQLDEPDRDRLPAPGQHDGGRRPQPAQGPELEAGRHLPLLPGGRRPSVALRRHPLPARALPAVHPVPVGHPGPRLRLRGVRRTPTTGTRRAAPTRRGGRWWSSAPTTGWCTPSTAASG